MGIYNLLNPSLFQGRRKKRSYFEGWYFKQTAHYRSDEKEDDVLAVIPGIAMNSSGGKQAFIQVFSSLEKKTWYIPYPYSSFSASKKAMIITIGNNKFTEEGISLAIDFQDLQLNGILKFSDGEKFPQRLFAPGIMGWYSFVPFMECFHGVVSMNHTVNGALMINGRTIDFSNGSGYIEKDWGISFPSSWVWMQSCDFSNKKNSCMLSVAKIPFLGRVFTGFLGFVLYNGNLLRFGSYTGAKLVSLKADRGCTEIIIRQGKILLEFSTEMGVSGHLAAPRQGEMDRIIQESLNGTILVTLRSLKKDTENEILYRDIGRLAGLEVSEVEQIIIDSN